MKQRVLLVGSYPPPYGGNSVHMLRLREALRAEFNIAVVDLYGERSADKDPAIIRCGTRKPGNALRAILALLRHPASIVHFHVSGMEAFLIAAYPMLAVIRRRTLRIVTIHSGSFVAQLKNGPSWRRRLLRDILRRFDRIVTVNREQKRFLEQIGIESSAISVIPAFLPPIARESPRAREALELLRGCDRVIVSSGSGFPYYGFHNIVEALATLDVGTHRYGLLLGLYNAYDEAYMVALERSMALHGVRGTLVRDLEPDEFAWLLQSCDVYVRATDRDGDAVAIREAQYFGKAVVASDCVERPPAAHLFSTGDSQSLAEALQAADEGKGALAKAEDMDGLNALLEIYREALRP